MYSSSLKVAMFDCFQKISKYSFSEEVLHISGLEPVRQKKVETWIE